MSQGTVRPTTDAAVDEGGSGDEGRATRRLVSSGAVMAAGTALSRVLGFVRLIVLVALFGNATRQSDMFNLANTVPNSMYILLAGGVLNTVLVPQLVRAVKRDSDGGEAYTNRVMTVGLLGLGLVTVLLTLAVPAVIALYSGPGWKDPDLAAQYASMKALAYWCMPQVFFYGVHVLAGQVLNARDRFGPMMWAPIANNVVSLAVLGLFALVFGRTSTGQAFTTAQEVVLGLGATVGIAVQAAVLVPFLRSAGYRFRPRLDLRGSGLGHTFRLARWTLGFVAVTQLALVVVNRLASEATVDGRGAGLTAYANAYAVWILPHSLITVSLATAMLPSASRLGAAGDLRGVAAETTRTVRLALTVLLPAAVGMVALGLPAAQLAFGFGRGARDASFVGWTLMALALGLVPFTVQYVLLRAFYALEDTRTTFFLQFVIAAVNVAAALALTTLLPGELWVAPALGLAYSLAYVVGALVSFRRLRRSLPDLDGHPLVAHCVRLLAAALPAAALGWLVCWAVTSRLGSRPALLLALVLAGVVAVGVFVVLARLLRVGEVAQLTGLLRRRRPAAPAGPADAVTSGEAPAEDELDTEVRSARSAEVVGAVESSVVSGGSEPPGGPGAPSIGAASTTPVAGLDRGDVPAAPGSTEDDLMTQTAIAPGRPHPLDATDEDGDADAVREPSAEFLHVPTAAALPTGTVLASRYRLEELIAASRPSVTWRAFDEVLSRSVLVHVLAPGDPDEPELMAAARRASVATDSRFLRVLDAVGGEESSVGSYIVCEYATGQSLEVLLSQAPLSGLEAAWVVREVADALSGVHGLGLHHRRINPENVIVTPSGNIKIVGLLIDAVLRPNRSTSVPGADTGELVDVADLGRLLYAALVSRWPGGPAYSLPAAPRLGRRWMTPRQVRAGVSPALDNVCDQVLGDPPRHQAPSITTAHQLVQALSKVLGSADATGDLERRLHQPIPVVQHGSGRAPASDPDTGAPPVSALLDQPTEEMTAIRPAVPGAAAPRTAGRRPAADAPVSRPRATPLAVAGPAGVTQQVAGAGGAGGAGSRPATATRTTPPQQHPRRWIAVLLALCLVLVVAGTVSAQVLSRRLGSSPAPSTSAAAPTTSDAPTTLPADQPVRVVSARDFDPQGDTREENREQVPLAIDGKDDTRWTTVTYKGNPKLGGIKRGVGLVLDLGEAQQVGSVRLLLSGDGTDVDLRVPATDPAGTTTPPMTSDRSWSSVATRSDVGSSATLTLDQPVTTRYVLVYLTSLPREGSGYKGGIYEAEVRS
ncbi:putative peptidoglycan lipid II flippase [Microlunatus sagamiharensis]|uniref:Putative peptidoglycan lipid II flippase n=1 Tax=Microlunatus sagamiharensis TaxID=546874 RepID=A0A1H2N6M0_9ACTN|nr:murein biosynthesis integral membrane protein MurJ [Microlunatus sagamiharensis]SDV00974.1 putative peptidoglycan lipid II flippase [Microlunatus sagamiharensis]